MIGARLIAVRRYGFPRREPILTLFLEDSDDVMVQVFRSSDTPTRHEGIAEFWASALYNHVEDSGDDSRFHALGESGAYRRLSADDGAKILGELVGGARSESLRLPCGSLECFVVHDSGDLRSVVGQDAHGFYAVFSERRRPSN